jgi:hypothetical protein
LLLPAWLSLLPGMLAISIILAFYETARFGSGHYAWAHRYPLCGSRPLQRGSSVRGACRNRRAPGPIRYTGNSVLHRKPDNGFAHMKYFLALLIVILVATGLVFINSGEQASDDPVTGLPWQIDILENGSTRVFGLTLGQTTFGEAIGMLGEDMDLAIIAAPGESGSLEAYYSHYSAGPITGKLILVLDISPDLLRTLRERAFQDGGTRRYHLHPDDLPLAYRSPVRIITFLPSFNLDEQIIQSRFGTSSAIIQVSKQQKHLLYPGKGLDIILNADGRELLQYLHPRAFSAHQAQLQQDSSAGE